MSEYDELIKRFCAAAGCKYVMKHYAEFPLDAKILDQGGKLIAVAEIAVKNFATYQHTHYMQTIWRLEEGIEASAKNKVPYLIICKFKDGELFYEFSRDHECERRQPKEEHTAHERRAIAGSVFIPMTYFQPLQPWPSTAKNSGQKQFSAEIEKLGGEEFEVEPL